jgi:feruloyl esterase
MVKTWDGPFTAGGKRMAYGFGPTIRQWPEGTDNALYGYFKRKEDGKLVLMPIAEQTLRWFTGNPDLDLHKCSYEEFERIYTDCRKKFIRYDFNDTDFTAYAKRGGKLMITHGTGDCIVPYQAAIDFYESVMDHFPSEKIMNQAVRMYMPDLAGHSILNWTGPAVACAVGMEALTRWTEEGIAPDTIPTVRYNFHDDCPYEESVVESFDQWGYKKKIRRQV